MVFVSVSETYDLATKPSKMTLIGIHTPTKDIIQKTYPGLCMNSKYCRIVKQDVKIACASMLPASVGEVGLGVDDIAPQDLFNPILYKAVSNDSMSTLEARLAGLSSIYSGGATIDGAQAITSNESVTGLDDEFNVYYALLSNRDGFKTANPQQGLTLTNLVPLVFEAYYNYGVNQTAGTSSPVDNFNTLSCADSGLYIRSGSAMHMRGKAHPMPKFNTTYLTGADTAGNRMQNGMGDGYPVNAHIQMPTLMPVYTACVVMPPSKRHLLFYRMVVRTTLEFSEVRPIQEITTFAQMNSNYAPMVYHSDYNQQSEIMTTSLGMVDSVNADLEKIMEGK